MTKLIKPVNIDYIIRSGVVLKSRKAYEEVNISELTNLCAIREYDEKLCVESAEHQKINLKLYQMTLEQFQNLKIGDIVVTKVISSKQNRINPVTNIDRGNLKLHIGRSGKWRSYSQFEVLTADYVVKWIKRRIDSKSSPHFTIEVKSDTEVIFKVHKKVQFNQ